MPFNHTLSAILRGQWLIDKQWADAHFPMVLSFIKGEPVNFGDKLLPKENINHTITPNQAALSYNVYDVQPNSDVKILPIKSITVVSLSGPLLKNGDICSYGMIDYAQLIKQIGNSSNVKGIILNIDSPGGQVTGTALLADVIKEISAKKPVISFINDGIAASAAMWIASAANEIYVAQSTDRVGSIGVYTQIADWNSYYRDALKLNVQDIYAPQSTDKNKTYEDAIAGDSTAIKEDLSVLANKFIKTIFQNRVGKIKGTSWTTGKMFYAAEAQKMGLIDGIKNFDQVIERMIQLSNQRTSQANNNSSIGTSQKGGYRKEKISSYADPNSPENAWFDRQTKYR